jgi:hypothetical protein
MKELTQEAREYVNNQDPLIITQHSAGFGYFENIKKANNK